MAKHLLIILMLLFLSNTMFAAEADTHPRPDNIRSAADDSPTWAELGMTSIILYLGDTTVPVPTCHQGFSSVSLTFVNGIRRLVNVAFTANAFHLPLHTAKYSMSHFCQLRL